MIVETASCYCGNVRASTTLSRPLASFSPRSCDCRFCTLHGIAYLSDPEGSLALEVAEPAMLSAFRQGTGQARFLLCARCGVVVAVVCRLNGRLHGALNARTLRHHAAIGAGETVSPRQLPGEARAERWSQLWFSEVTGVPSGV
ncbi:MAG: aldehyde-activating protein [Pseudomonadota bacterium]